MSQSAYLGGVLTMLPPAPQPQGSTGDTINPYGTGTTPARTNAIKDANDIQLLTWKWIGAWIATWIVLAGTAEYEPASKLAASFAIGAAFVASVALLPKATNQILGGLA